MSDANIIRRGSIVESSDIQCSVEGPAVLELADANSPICPTSGSISGTHLYNIDPVFVSSTMKWNFDANRIETLTESYVPVLVGQSIETIPVYCRNRSHNIGGLYSQLNMVAWCHELSYENDIHLKDFIQFGIINGFYIVNPEEYIEPYFCSNYSSVLHGDAFLYVDELLKDELKQQKYILTDEQPHCVHSLGAIPKSDGTFRPITDCKRPLGLSINNYMSEIVTTFSYHSIDDVVSLMSPGDYMATVDISSAYRSFSVHPDHWKFQGVTWEIDGQQRFMLHTRVCFGLKNAPFLYTHLSNFVVRCMHRRGYLKVVNYLDDFIVIGNSFESCQEAQNMLIRLLISLGFYISWRKCTSPNTFTRYLGIDFDSISMTISLPSEKMEKLHQELNFFNGRRRATKRQIQRLCGILSQCGKVVKGARTFSRRVIDLLKGLSDGNPRITLTKGFCDDLEWWKEFSLLFNGTSCCVQYNFGEGPQLFTDASQNGYGITCGSDWQAGGFNTTNVPVGLGGLTPSHEHWQNISCDTQNINVLELIPIWLALTRLGSQWANLHVICRTDNTQVMQCINKGVSVNFDAMVLRRKIFWLCVYHNIHLTSRHIRGVDNVVADKLSRLHTFPVMSTLTEFHLCCSGSAYSRS